MPTTKELPDCHLLKPPILISPSNPTPHHALYLSNLDDQKFLRFSIKYLYLFRKSVPSKSLKASLARALVDYYPLAGRLRSAGNSGGGGSDDDQRLEVDCNGEGAVFAEGSMDITADEFLEISQRPNRSWRKLLYKVEAHSFLSVPPLIVQVTNLRCGGMILCTAISHCLCDGIGTSQFLQAWAHLHTKPGAPLPVLPFHSRHVFRPQSPPHATSPHPAYTRSVPSRDDRTAPLPDVHRYLQSQPLTPVSVTFTPSLILRLKRQCVPSLKCTSFEALAAHTWRSWARSLVDPSSPSSSFLTSLHAVKLLFSVNVRDRLDPKLPHGYYGNGFVLGCAPATVRDLVGSNLANAVKLVQAAKSRVDGDYVRSALETLEDKAARTDLSASLVISQWSNLGLEDIDFGEGKAAFMGPLASDVYCLFLPVTEEPQAVRVLVSMPECAAEKFEFYMKGFVEREEKNGNGYGGEGDGLCCDDL